MRKSRLGTMLGSLFAVIVLFAGAAGLSHAAEPGKAPAPRTVTLTDANNKGTVTLHPGDSLIVGLESNLSTGYSWHPLMELGFPLQFTGHSYVEQTRRAGSHATGMGGVEEFRYRVPVSAKLGSVSLAAWQRFFYLRPFEADVKNSRVWEVRVVVKD